VQSKADDRQLNLTHGTDNPKVEKKEKLKSKKTDRGIRDVSPEEEKQGCSGKDLQKRKFISL